MLACGRTSSHNTQPWSFDDNAGVAMRTPNATCLSIPQASLAPGGVITVVLPASTPQEVAMGRVVRANGACRSADTDDHMHRYEIRLERATPAGLPMIALTGVAGAFQHRGDVVAADLDGDRRDELFRSCTSTEGVHLTIWSEAILTGRRRWHRYVFLGYDVEPTCTPADVGEK